MYNRALNLTQLIKRKSLILIGPRQTGKSTLVRELSNKVYINLADSEAFRRLSARPELIREELSDKTKVLIIDEAQRLPDIFNEAQNLIDLNRELRVILTGSSARKLKRNNFNLLPGRVWIQNLFPLISHELGGGRIDDRCARGGLPGIIDSKDYKRELREYVSSYLEEEVRQEALTRNIGNFARFLDVCALSNGEQINYSNISKDAEIKESTTRLYFQVLSDTLIGTILEPYRKTRSRKAVATPKFYFFDWGIVNGLLNRFEIVRGTEVYGKALEHIIYQELTAYIRYREIDLPLNYWRSESKFEVDFVVGDQVAIEVKAKNAIHDRDLRGLRVLKEEKIFKRFILICHESKKRRTEDGIEIIPIENFLEELWNGELL